MKNVAHVLTKARKLLNAGMLTTVAALSISNTVHAQCTTIDPIGGTGLFCAGSYGALTGSPSGGTWSSSNTAVVSNGLLAVAPGTATVTYTYAGGCGAGYVTKTVTVNALPALVTATADFCSIDYGGYTQTTPARLLTSEAGVEYTLGKAHWLPTVFNPVGTATGTGGTANFSYIPPHSSVDWYSVDAYNPTTGCSRTVSDVFQTRALPTPNILVMRVGCAGTQSPSYYPAISFNAPYGDPIYDPTFTMSTIIADTTIARTAGPYPGAGIFDYLSAGTTPVYVVANNGCADTGILTVDPVNDPDFTINDNTQDITGNSFQFTALLTHSTAHHEWRFGDSTGTSNSTAYDTVLHSYGESSVYNVTHISASAGCPHQRITKKVYVFADGATVYPIEGNASFCEGGTMTMVNETPGGTWNSSNTAVATIDATTGEFAALTPGTTTISYIVGSDMATKEITVNAIPIISGTTTVCVGATTTLNSSVPGSTWSKSYSSYTVAVHPTTGVVTGVWGGSAIIIAEKAGCSSSVAVNVTGVDYTYGPNTVCAGSAVTFTNATPGGTWSSANTAIATVDGSGNVTGVAAGTVNISYNITGICTLTSTKSITVKSPSITGTRTLCPGSTTTLANTGGASTWSSGNTGVATINTSSGVVTGVANGTATITCSKDGCAATTVVTVNTVASITGTGAVCAGGSLSLANASSGGTWSSSNTSVATIGSASGVLSAASAGTSTISYIVSAGCYSTASVTVSAAVAAITGATAVCEGSSITLSNATGGGTWSSGNTAIATINEGSGVLSGVDDGTVTITYATAGAGCYTTATVTVNALPASITGTGSICAGSTLNLSNATDGGTWSSSSTSVATVGSATGVVSGVGAGTATITYTVNGCYVTTVVTVKVVPASISGAGAVCVGSTQNLSNATGSGAWSSSNASVATVGTSGIVTGASAGTATITYDIDGCYTTATVTVNALPASITGTGSICTGSTLNLSSTTGGGTWSSSNGSVATVGSSTGVVTGTGAGTATITYTASGCYTTTVVTVVALPASIGGTSALCVGNAITLTNTTGGGTWASSNGSIASIGSSSGVLTGVSPGTITVTYTASGCSRTAGVTVSAAVASITGTAVVCKGTNSTLACSTGGGTWASSNGSVATVDSSTGAVTSVNAGTTTITYRVNAGCINTRVYTVNTQPGTISGSSLVIGSATMSCSPSGGTWSSSNTAKATVNSSGVVTATGSGSAVISYHIGSCYATKSISCIALKPEAPATPEVAAIAKFNLFPNPTSGTFTIEAPVAGTLTVHAADGRLIERYNINAAANTITLPAYLAAGTYMCHFTGADGSSEISRLIYQP